jgi:hypothetical protein
MTRTIRHFALVLAAAVSAVAFAAAGAASASTTTPSNLSLTISPASVLAPVGAYNASQTVTLFNSGSQDLRVAAGPALLHGCSSARSPAWVHVTGIPPVLKSGQSARSTITVDAPRSLTGNVTLAAVFAGAPVARGGTIGVNGEIAAKITLRLPGPTLAVNRPCAAAPKHQGGLSALPVGGGAALLVILATGAIWLLRSRRRTLAVAGSHARVRQGGRGAHRGR